MGPLRIHQLRVEQALLLMIMLSGCSIHPARQTELMSRMGLTASRREAQLAVSEFCVRASGIVEVASDQILLAASDPAIRESAIRWKLDTMTQFQKCAFQSDPAIALVDLWVFSVQIREYLEEGAGKQRFGPHQRLAIEAAVQVEDEVIDMIKDLLPASTRDHFAAIDWDVRRFVYRWAAEHPLNNPVFVRESVAARYADFAVGRDVSVLGAPGATSDLMQAFLDRASVYALHAQKSLQWHEDLLMLRMDQAISRMMVEAPELAAWQARHLLTRLDSLIAGHVDLLTTYASDEGRALLDNVKNEGQALMAGVRQERVEAMREIRDERVAATRDLRELAFELVQSAMEDGEARARNTLDRSLHQAVLWFLLPMALLLAAALLVFCMGWKRIRRCERIISEHRYELARTRQGPGSGGEA